MKTRLNRLAKTAALAAFMFIAFTMSAFAKPVEVSKYLERQLQLQFEGASNVIWKTSGDFTSATFTLQNEKVSVYYNQQYDLVAVSKDINLQDVPKKALETIITKYTNQDVVSVIALTDAEGVVNYYVQIESDGKQTILKSDEYGSVSVFKNE